MVKITDEGIQNLVKFAVDQGITPDSMLTLLITGIALAKYHPEYAEMFLKSFSDSVDQLEGMQQLTRNLSDQFAKNLPIEGFYGPEGQ